MKKKGKELWKFLGVARVLGDNWNPFLGSDVNEYENWGRKGHFLIAGNF